MINSQSNFCQTPDFSQLAVQLRSLTVFRALLSDEVVHRLMAYLDCRSLSGASVKETVDAYAEFVAALYETNLSLGRHIRHIVNNNENVYVKRVGMGESPSPCLQASVDAELCLLQQIADLTPSVLRRGLAWEGYLPDFEVSSTSLAEDYRHRVEHIGQYGYGIYARYRMFWIDGDDKILPVRNPDKTRLSDLVDYKREQQILLDNTRALLCGKPAANALLTGDAGTGKSSTVKAIVNELADEGLRILEIRKEQLREIPAILDELSTNPLKFILFIDDLSFGRDDDNFSALKAILEGSVSAKSRNVVIYATSNRRHLVKERFSDREGDDVHFNDSMQEIVSLSERFGLQITFSRPDKKTYLDIVHHLAQERGICMDPAQLDAEAERFVLGRGTRSARAAKQFVDSLSANARENS